MAPMMAWAPRHETRLQDADELSVSAIRRSLLNDGYVILKNFFDNDTIVEARKACEKLADQTISKLVEKGSVSSDMKHLGLEERLAKVALEAPDEIPSLYRHELHMPEFFDVFFCPKLLDLMIALMDADEVRLYPNYSVRPKVPDSDAHEVLWHQDAGLKHDGSPSDAPVQDRLDAFGHTGSSFSVVNCWTCLVPATKKNGCMQFIPASHKKGIAQHVLKRQTRKTDAGHQSKAEEAGHGTYSTQIDPAVVEPLLDKAVDVETDPGDLVLFSNMLFHRGQPNTSEHVRWSIDWRYQNAAKPTLRPQDGHIARSLSDIDREIQTPEEWTAAKLE